MSIIQFKHVTFIILSGLLITAPQLFVKAGSPSGDKAAKLFAYDRKVVFDLKEESTKVQNGVIVRDVNYAAHSPRQGRVKAYIVRPEGKGPFAGVLFFHWLGRSKSDRTQFLDEAITLAGQGVVSILIQGYFPWSQPPTEAKADRQQVIDQTIEARRALDLLLMQPDVDAKRIGYVGHDYGAMYGSILAGLDNRVKTYVLIAGMGNFGDWSLKYWPATGAQGAAPYRQTMKEVDPIEYISRAKPARLLFQFASRDIFISRSVADEFYAAASEPKQAMWYDSEHDLDMESVRNDRREWLTKHLGLSQRSLGKETKEANDQQAVLGVLRKLAAAGMERDVATIDRFYTDDFFHTNADGSMMSKSEVLDSYRAAPTVTYESDAMDNEKVQVFGDAAVVSCRVTLKGRTADGRPFTTPFRVTNVFRKRSNNWLLTASHASVMR